MSPSGSSGSTTSSGRILAVDDQAANLRVVGILLGRNGYEVVPAANGAEALAAAQAHTPDLILLDLMMPGMDGFEMIRRLRANPDLSRMDIIVVSAIDREEVVKRGLPADITIFGKPIPFHEIKGFLLGRLAARQRSA